MKGVPRTAVLLLVLVTAGCFHYVPVEEVPSQGSPVRVRLSEPVAMELTDITANNIVAVRGEVVTTRSEQLALSAFTLTAASEFEHLADGQTVYIPRELIVSLEEKRLSWARTALATTATFVTVYLLDRVLRGNIGQGEPPPPPPDQR